MSYIPDGPEDEEEGEIPDTALEELSNGRGDDDDE